MLGAATWLLPVESPVVPITLMVITFIAVFPAFRLNPHRDLHGSETIATWKEVLATAPIWTTVLLGVAVALAVAAAFALPELLATGRARIPLTSASLAGRPDRVRAVAASLGAVCAYCLRRGMWARALRAKLLTRP
jgi:hypothetical protein